MDPSGSSGKPRPVPAGSTLYKNIGTLHTLNSTLSEIKDGAIFVKGNVIQWVGKTKDLPAEFSTADDVIRLENRVVIPGMVNTHHHMVQSLTRCVAQDSKLFGWLTSLYPAWGNLSGYDVYIATKLAMAELILTGCTTTSDHLYIYPNDVKLEDCIKASREIGMRFHPTRGAMTLGQSKGGLPPDNVCEEEDAALATMKQLIEDFHDNSKYSMLRMGLAPCSPFTVDNSLMIAAAKLARQYEGVRLHTHLAENQEDIDFSIKTYGCRPGKYITDVGWDASDVWFAHCCMLDDAEMKQFHDNGIGIAHCPSSNLRLASGIAPVRTLLDTGVNVGLGVDGSASNDCGHLLAEARLAMLLQRHTGNAQGMTIAEAFDVAVKGGARNLGRDDIGEIASGYAADFVAWRTDTIGFSGGRIDEAAALLLCGPSVGFVDLSVINGEAVVKDGKFTTIDLTELVKAHNACSARICSFLGPNWKTGSEPAV
ncbi:Atrazine chlorohydrolase/guanine deaminase [Klebsormidium nitens]|uniref:Atrazine chlorohydrolase/guanine deaminase n=1 Tax=Klebsormidium nitens TaxID=105231 RepID=A0A1Y1I5I0_KLENI|nr:Atrazine chlorohydrolase/guanine deaminase [Klebsormidium nitens]|eukprot:GAQ83977.1 Atrazine chlorohydrolase/guanine deaminase [Klebsormidium nitens]